MPQLQNPILFSALAAAIMVAIFLPGLAFLEVLKTELKPLERICLSFVIGILCFAGLGLLIPLCRQHLHPVMSGAVGVVELGSIFTLLLKRNGMWWRAIKHVDIRLPIAVYLSTVILGLSLCFLEVRFPDPLVDGPYVFKSHHLHVKIQLITGDLPADNYIPFVFSDFILRGISFKDERPMLPGQEVTNRTALMALVGSTVRSVISPPEMISGALGKFRYVNTNWPDVGRLGTDDQYGLFLVVAVILQALFILSAFLYFSELFDRRIVSLALLTIPLNPYFLSQVVFIWPKMFGAFFLLLCAYTLQFARKFALAGLLLGLAYHCHPLAVLFFPGYGLFVFREWRKKRISYRRILDFCGTLSIVLAPWLVWVKFIVKIPPDLARQNLWIFEAQQPWLNFFYVRVVTLFDTLIPSALASYPFQYLSMLRQAILTLPGAIGLLTFPFAYYGFAKSLKKADNAFLYFFFIPLLCICLTFSLPTAAAVHGFQALTPLFVILAVETMMISLNRQWFLGLYSAGLGFNLLLIFEQGRRLGAFKKIFLRTNLPLLLLVFLGMGTLIIICLKRASKHKKWSVDSVEFARRAIPNGAEFLPTRQT